jgi:hypothetical protein
MHAGFALTRPYPATVPLRRSDVAVGSSHQAFLLAAIPAARSAESRAQSLALMAAGQQHEQITGPAGGKAVRPEAPRNSR